MVLPQKVLDEIPFYKSNLSKFLAGEMQDAFFRGIRVPWGFYSQRGGKLLMARLRVPNGILTPLQLHRIGKAANTYADGTTHITTRQDIQIHNLPAEHTLQLIEELAEVHISPRAGGGNTIRNITGCYGSGICPREHREVYRTVWGLTEHLLSLDECYTMPRKIKMAFSGCEQDCACTGVNDMGFIAHRDGFKVLCGGGMGAKSTVGKVLHESIEEKEIGYTVKSVLNLFNAHGNRKKRHHNRLRFLIQDLGWERFRQLYRDELHKVKDNENIVLKTRDELPHLPRLKTPSRPQEDRCHQDKAYAAFLTYHAEKQKQEGYHSVHLRVPLGEITADALISLSQLSEAVPAVSFRTTQRQNLIIANVPGSELPHVYEKVKTLFNLAPSAAALMDSTCCKGATTCNLGICNAVGLAAELLVKLGHIKLHPQTMKQVTININGCPNACGQHPIGLISFSGMVKKVFNRSVPFYRIHLGGSINAERTVLAGSVGTAPARSIPAILCEFISALQDSAGGDVYHYVTTRGKELMKGLVEKHASVPPYEEDATCYRDFGKGENFSLEGLTQGECGSGVIDMIESDLESARQLVAEAQEKDLDVSILRSALLFSARSLLVIKGVDPQGEIEIINAFMQKFISTGICSPEFTNLKDVFEGITSGTIPGKSALDYITSLYHEVRETYARIDSNFNFPVRYHQEHPQQAPEASKLRRLPVYDLRGTPCPINYVKIKLKLETLQGGQLLEVYLDEGEPIRSVPRSLQNDGQEILKTEREDTFYKVTIRKKV